MTESHDPPPDPPPPEIDASILRRLAEAPPPGDETADAVPAPEPEVAAPAASVEDPELPGIALTTRIEALLFVATEPLPLRRIKELLRVEDGRALREAIDGLATSYDQAASAMRVEEVAGGFQLRTRPELAPVVARIGRKAQPEKLSAAALETLAIVAYRQPVLRADIERIRGVASGEVLRALQERDLVRVAGRAELPGSPLYYGTTTRFLEIFGLRDLQELPRDAETLRPPS